MEWNFNDLTFENIDSWPSVVKISVVVALTCAMLILGYWLDTRSQLQSLNDYRSQEKQKLIILEKKQQEAANLGAYQVQLKKINDLFQNLLRQLPTRSEVPGLLEDISKTGVANGLEFKLFKPMPEIQAVFYAELPIQISVIGNYHQLAQFISGVANLDRIVTLHDFSIYHEPPNPEQKDKPGAQPTDKLVLDMTAKTYRYTGDEKPQ